MPRLVDFMTTDPPERWSRGEVFTELKPRYGDQRYGDQSPLLDIIITPLLTPPPRGK
jgi:hypothetical protein